MIKVSTSIITYNHEKYVAQAVESALMQETDFDCEIIIGEDDSSDRTREIVKDYGARYPGKIRLFLNDRRNVIHIGGRPTGRWNFVNNLKHARGQYVALLEGDDYWTDRQKLQKQVDFLESHPDAAVCFHDVWVVHPNHPDMSHPFYVQSPDRPSMHKTPKPRSTLEDLLKGNFIQTPSVMYRAGLFDEFPTWYYELDRGDWPLYVLNAQHGWLGYIDEAMAVHRVHSGGIYSSKSRAAQLEGAMEAATVIDRHLGFEHHEIISAANADRLARIVTLLAAARELGQARAYAWRYVAEHGLADRRSRALLWTLFEAYSPRGARAARHVYRMARMAGARGPHT